jgi:hypothetical protein
MASVVTIFTVRLAQERDRANLETTAATAMNRFLADDLLGQADPFQSGTSQQTLIDAVSQAAPRIDAQFAAQPLIAARLHQAVAEALDNRFDRARARTEYLRAEQLFRQADGEKSEDAIGVSLRRAAVEASFASASSLSSARHILASAEGSLAQIPHPRADLSVRLKFDRATIAVHSNDLASANRDFAAALSDALAIPSFPPRQILRIREAYAYSCTRAGDPNKAEKLLRQVIEDYRSLGETDSPALLRARIYLAQSLLQQKRFFQALNEANSIYPAVVKKLGSSHETTFVILGTRAAAEGSLGLWPEAIRDDLTVYEIVVQKQGADSMDATAALADAALSQCRSGRLAQGELNARRALASARKNSGPRSSLAGAVSYALATCLCLSNKLDEATATLGTIDVPSVTQLIGDPTFPAGIVLSEAEIAFRRGDFALARQKLAAAAPVFQNPNTDAFERQRMIRLEKALVK